MKKTQKIIVALLILTVSIVAALLFVPHCDRTCRAYEIKRSVVFFELVKLVNHSKNTSPESLIVVDKEMFPKEVLERNHISYWGVTASGAIFIANEKNMLFVAEQRLVNGAAIWTCSFYPEPIVPPICLTLKTN